MVQVLDKLNIARYFIPRKLEGYSVQFLKDMGCTTNLLSKYLTSCLLEYEVVWKIITPLSVIIK